MSAFELEDERPPRELWEWAFGVAVVAACSIWIAYRLHVVDVRWDSFFPRIGSLVFRDTTTNGGDMGAHVYWPWFLEHNWFLKGRLSGWSPSWYSGFPIGQYYFPFPAVLTSIFDLLLPYNVAFKIVTVLGPITLPVGTYLLADQLDFPWPAAPLTSVATLYYQFELRHVSGGDTSWTIYGGNLASGLAGEYSFTLSLSLAMFFLAAFVFTLKTGKRAWLPTVLLACCVTSHIVVAMAAAFLGVLIWLAYRPRRTWRIAVPIGTIAALLTMVWTLPLVATEPYTSSMRYEKFTTYSAWIFGPGPYFKLFGIVPLPTPIWIWALVLAALIGGGFWLRRSTLIVVIWTTAFALAFRYWPQDLAVWNTRFIPFYFLGLAFMAALGVAEIARACTYGLRWITDWHVEGARLDRVREWRSDREAAMVRAARAVRSDHAELVGLNAAIDAVGTVGGANANADDGGDGGRSGGIDDEGRSPAVAPSRDGEPARELEVPASEFDELDAVLVAESMSAGSGELPSYLRRGGRSSGEWGRRRSLSMSIVLIVVLVVTSLWAGIAADAQGSSLASYWAKWNYSGYEAKGAAWTEYSDLMFRMGEVGKRRGCGRAMWEPSAGKTDNVEDPISLYGTSLALELLPYWTDNCIGSMEGLYFESSATKDAHFLTVSELSQHPSNPVRGLNYGSTGDFAQGIVHARMLGVRYLMFWAKESLERADASQELSPVLSTVDHDGSQPKGWKTYEIKDWSLVTGLSVEPVVAKLQAGTKSTCWPGEPKPAKGQLDTNLNAWECATGPWWMNAAILGQTFSENGPSTWQHVGIKTAAQLTKVPQHAIVPAIASHVVEKVDSISFDVDQIGKPVVVRTSFFPNWEVAGAKGPWRISPNLMVVVPTARHVKLTYGLTTPDWIGRLATLLGIILLAGLAFKFGQMPRSWTFARQPKPSPGGYSVDDASRGANVPNAPPMTHAAMDLP